VVAQRPAHVEEVVVGVDEEVLATGAVDVVEGRDRRRDQRARPDRPAGAAHHHAEPILFAEALEQVLHTPGPAVHADLERGAAQLP
jgi:hypothetical protein